jgi:hypothetical protein
MHRALFNSWKFALLWAIGISASVAAFFADGGGHEQLEASAEQIREKRGSPYRQEAEAARPVPQPAVAAVDPATEDEPDEPEFGEPMFDPSADGEAKPKPVAPPVRKPAADEEEF